ncbi:hypothetical protein DAI22_11g127400 [Oryza sativa Japonica Group]|nr:hypothetical protein DAI22_11g127400 [Oryza sativa Japonica Group]
MGGAAAHLRPGRSGPRTRSHRCRTGSSLPPPNHRAHFLPQLQSPAVRLRSRRQPSLE